MFGSKMKATAFAICGAFIIGVSSGTAQASVAEENLIGQQQAELNFVSNGSSNFLRNIYREKVRREHQREWNERQRRDWNDRGRHDYGAPPPPPSRNRGNDYGAPPPPPRR